MGVVTRFHDILACCNYSIENLHCIPAYVARLYLYNVGTTALRAPRRLSLYY